MNFFAVILGVSSVARFNALIDEVAKTVEPTVRARGGHIEQLAEWESDSVNATAYRTGDVWTIRVWGGLYRAPGVDEDGFQLAVCHEAGHLLGGFPFYNGAIAASSEGEADYYSAYVCAPRLWRAQAERNAQAFQAAPAAVKAACLKAHPAAADAAVCARIAVAGEKMLNALSGGGGLSLATPSTDTATVTLFSAYPEPQCRVDTYFRGALCARPWDMRTIPGYGQDPLNGMDAERDALAHSCNSEVQPDGARPACWFSQRVEP
jgi:hypothetical protein